MERPTEIPYRWTAQDAAGASPKPAKIENPYGINPDEVFLSTGRPPPEDKRWAARFLDGDVVSLPASKCRIQPALDQFFLDGYMWEEAPKDLTAATLGELCQKLFDRAEKYAIFADFSTKAPPPATPEAARALGNRRNLLLKKLLGYWGNTDYRWAVLHGGVSPTTVDQAPEGLPTQATGSAGAVKVSAGLTWVLARAMAQGAVNVVPNVPEVKGPKKATTLVVPKAQELVPLPPPPPLNDLNDLAPELIETLKNSFIDRHLGLPLAGANLMYGWREGKPEPATLWHALDNLGPTAVNFLVRMFDRTRAIDGSLALWKQIKYIRNQWWRGSAGMKVIYHDPVAVRACLDALFDPRVRPTVARDKYLGSLEHQSSASWKLAPKGVYKLGDIDQEPPDCNTWREVDKLGQEAMHYCVDKGDLKGEERTLTHDDIHIDWASPVDGVEPGRNQCTYGPGTGVLHWGQAMIGLGQPELNISSVQEGLAEGRAQLLRSDRAADFLDFEKRWTEARWKLAVRGKPGEDEAGRYNAELKALYQSVLPEPPPPRPGVKSP
jgi:hypothetical protein